MFTELNQFAEKANTFAVKSLDFQFGVTKQTVDFFDSITDKKFYTYTQKALETVRTMNEYAKENITKIKDASVFGSGK